MANKVIGNYTAAASIDGANHFLLIQPGTSATPYLKINRNVLLGVTGQPMDTSTTQTVTNKTFGNTNVITVRDDRFTLQDSADTTKQAVFELSGLTTATTRTYTLPNASSTIADISTTQTFTNKTLTSPVITGGSITGSTITTDAIVGQSIANSGTIYGLPISSGKVGTNGVVTASLTNTIVTPNKLNLGPAGNTTAVSGTTTSTSFTSTLTGSTAQTATVTVGANGILLIGIWGQISNSGANLSAMGFALSGANTAAATNQRSVAVTGTSAMWIGSTFLVTGLAAGSTVATMNFAVAAGTGTYGSQHIWALPL